jgi:putative peptidoglycan lipid II flippase
MNLIKAIGTIGGLTMVSRVLGFARDMIGADPGRGRERRVQRSPSLMPNIFRAPVRRGRLRVRLRAAVQPPAASGGHEDASVLQRDPRGVHADAGLVTACS